MRLQWRRLWPKLELRTGQALPETMGLLGSNLYRWAQGSLLGFAYLWRRSRDVMENHVEWLPELCDQ